MSLKHAVLYVVAAKVAFERMSWDAERNYQFGDISTMWIGKNDIGVTPIDRSKFNIVDLDMVECTPEQRAVYHELANHASELHYKYRKLQETLEYTRGKKTLQFFLAHELPGFTALDKVMRVPLGFVTMVSYYTNAFGHGFLSDASDKMRVAIQPLMSCLPRHDHFEAAYQAAKNKK